MAEVENVSLHRRVLLGVLTVSGDRFYLEETLNKVEDLV